jgi:hypothetical protein
MTIDGFGKNTRVGSFPNTSGPTKQKRLCKVIIPDCIFEGSGYVRLPDDTVKSLRTILSCRNNKIFHQCKLQFFPGTVKENIEVVDSFFKILKIQEYIPVTPNN